MVVYTPSTATKFWLPPGAEISTAPYVVGNRCTVRVTARATDEVCLDVQADGSPPRSLHVTLSARQAHCVALLLQGAAKAATTDTAPAAEAPRFEIRNLARLSYAAGFTFWHYRSGATVAQLRASGHFTDACDILHLGDMIALAGIDGTGLAYVQRLDPVAGVVLGLPL